MLIVDQSILFLARTRAVLSDSRSTSSESTKHSTDGIKMVMQKLIALQNRASTTETYLMVWRQFNRFLINLDYMPRSWKDRATLFITFKIEKGLQSNSVKSYVSAIKRILSDDGYQWDNNKMLLSSLTKACRLINDSVRTRLPIQCNLLEVILHEVG